MMGGLPVATILTLILLPALNAAWYRVPLPAEVDLQTPSFDYADWRVRRR
ncbi:MAG: hypothetical protein ABW034_18205 [Steroidobacteraceae bacterium]